MSEHDSTSPSPTQPLLSVRGLTVAFIDAESRSSTAVEDVELSVQAGEIVAVVGESGSGKSVAALSIMGLLPKRNARVSADRIRWRGENLAAADERRLRSIRGSEIAMIFQEPAGSLNPVRTVGEQVAEAIRLHRTDVARRAMRGEVESALRAVGIPDPPRVRRAHPHELSGGMCQRVMIATALACEPRLLLADEPTTALDVTIQAQVLDLLQALRRERGMSVLLISHDLGVVAAHADIVHVMYAGRIVESAPKEALFDRPAHPYTRALLASIPTLRERRERLGTVAEVVRSGADQTVALADGSRATAWWPRDASDAERNGFHQVRMREVGPDHRVSVAMDAGAMEATAAQPLADQIAPESKRSNAEA